MDKKPRRGFYEKIIRIHLDHWKKLNELAKKENVSAATVLHRILSKYFKEL